MTLELLSTFLFHLALTALPATAAVLVAARTGVRSTPVLLAFALVGIGAASMAAFWAYYLSPAAGKVFTIVALGSALAVLVLSIVRDEEIVRSVGRQMAIPFGLWALGSAFILFLGFAHGGVSAPLATSGTRFSHPLPGDNVIPSFFAEWLYFHGHERPPMFPGGWLSSDRPPLQSGAVLLQRPGYWGNPELHYQIIGVLLQQLWIVGSWAFLLAARVGRVTRTLVMVTLLVSGVVLVNSFFVWPKLLPAAMLMAATGLVATAEWTNVQRAKWGAVLVGSLLALAFLGHGASAFMLIPLAAIVLVRSFRAWRWIALAALVGVALLAPWSAYQTYGDPPGNRLTKWMLGGAVEVDSRGTVEAIVEGYEQAGVDGALDNKLQSFDTMTGNLFSNGEAIESVRTAMDEGIEPLVRALRVVSFFFLLPALGLLIVAPIAMLLAWFRGVPRGPEWTAAITCGALALVGCVVWGAVLFGGPDVRPSIHIGSLALPILAISGLVLGLRASFPRFAVWFVGLNAVLSLTLYAPALDAAEGSGYSIAACLVAAASLGLFIFVSARVDGHLVNDPASIDDMRGTMEPLLHAQAPP